MHIVFFYGNRIIEYALKPISFLFPEILWYILLMSNTSTIVWDFCFALLCFFYSLLLCWLVTNYKHLSREPDMVNYSDCFDVYRLITIHCVWHMFTVEQTKKKMSERRRPNITFLFPWPLLLPWNWFSLFPHLLFLLLLLMMNISSLLAGLGFPSYHYRQGTSSSLWTFWTPGTRSNYLCTLTGRPIIFESSSPVEYSYVLKDQVTGSVIDS